MILVDTSVWVEFFRQTDSPQDRRLTGLIEDGEDIAITGIVLTEILQGIRHERELRAARGYLLRFPLVEPMSVFTYLRAAEIYRACRRRGLTVRGSVDCIIAAICIDHDVPILHRDADFDRIAAISGLKVLAV